MKYIDLKFTNRQKPALSRESHQLERYLTKLMAIEQHQCGGIKMSIRNQASGWPYDDV
ncbi:MAG: hypothetical protein ACI8PP_002913, partial [Candidatus Pseudothioglobus sp.]